DGLCRQSPGPKYQREIFGGLLREAAGYLTSVVDLAVDIGRGLYFVVQDDSQAIIYVFAGSVTESPCTVRQEREVNLVGRAAVLRRSGGCVTHIDPGDDRIFPQDHPARLHCRARIRTIPIFFYFVLRGVLV